MRQVTKFGMYCVMTPSGLFYQGGSYGGRFGSWPKVYSKKANAEAVIKRIDDDVKRLSYLPPGLTPMDIGKLFVKEVEVRV